MREQPICSPMSGCLCRGRKPDRPGRVEVGGRRAIVAWLLTALWLGVAGGALAKPAARSGREAPTRRWTARGIESATGAPQPLAEWAAKQRQPVSLLVAPGAIPVKRSATLPVVARLRFLPGARLQLASGVRLTILGSMEAGAEPLFQGQGEVVFKRAPALALPQWWGARGDGKADDTAPIQRCLDAVSGAGGGAVRLRRGTYRVDRLRLRSKVALEGEGDESLLEAITYRPTRANPALLAQEVDDWSLRRLRFRGPDAPSYDLTAAPPVDDMQAAEYASLLLIRGARRGRVSECRFERFPNGITIWRSPPATAGKPTPSKGRVRSQGIVVRDCRFVRLSQGVLTAYSEQLTLSDLDFDTMLCTQSRAQHGIYINLETRRFTVTNITGRNIAACNPPTGAPNLVQIKGEYGTVSKVVGSDMASLLSMVRARYVTVTQVTGRRLNGGSPYSAIYMNEGEHNHLSQATLECRNMKALYLESEIGGIVSGVAATIEADQPGQTAISIGGGAYNRVSDAQVSFTRQPGVAFDLVKGVDSEYANLSCRGAQTGVLVRSGRGHRIDADASRLRAQKPILDSGLGSRVRLRRDAEKPAGNP